jgi:hypothetical protein
MGTAAVVVACAANRINKRQADMQQNASQPVFRIAFPLYKLNGTEEYDTEVVEVFNDGNILKSFNCKVETFYHLKHTAPRINENYYVPIIGYHFAQGRFTSLSGKLMEGYLTNNHTHFIRLYDEAMVKSKGNVFYSIYKITIIKINYVDINNDKYTVYFKNRDEISKEEYDSIKDLANQYFEDFYENDVEKVTLDGILKHIASKKDNSFDK